MFFSSDNVFILLSFLKEWLFQVDIEFWVTLVFLFSILMMFHCLFTILISDEELGNLNLIPFYLVCHFSLSAFKILPLFSVFFCFCFLVFISLIWCLVIIFIEFILFRECSSSWIWKFVFHQICSAFCCCFLKYS